MDLMLWVLRAALLLSRVVVVAAAYAVTSATSAAHREGGDVDLSANAVGGKYAIASIFPESGPTRGGTYIILTGIGIIDGDDLVCAFGRETNDDVDTIAGAISDARRMSRTEIMCVAPEWDVRGDNVTLSLESRGIVVATSPSLFHYYETPIIDSIYPTSGAAHGGTRITLRGSGFLSWPGMTCRLGLVDVPALWEGNDEVTCTSPPGAVASTPHMLSFSLNGADHSASPVMYRYTESPVVRSISPIEGSISGGTSLAVTGQGFEDSLELKCVFRLHINHTYATTAAKYMSPSELTCMSPVVDKPTRATVHVTVNGVDATVEGARFDYIKDPVIKSIRPASGPVDGGTWVNLIGTGMVNGNSSRCSFDKSDPGSVYWISQTEIQCISPPARGSGIVNVTLVDYPLTFLEYFYYEHPMISSIQPSFGVSSGGTLVTLHGSGFLSSQDIVCRFGSIDVPAYFITEEQISCLSPPGNAGSSHCVSLSLNGVDFSPSSKDYLYISPVEVQSSHPRWMDEAGGALMKVIGSGFLDSDELACIFQKGQMPPFYVRATYVSFTELQCLAPQMSATSEVLLRVTANGVDVSPSGAQLEYVRSVVSTIYPMHGPVTGGTHVRLIGSGFQPEDTNCCRFGEKIVPAKWMSRTMVQCETPLSSAGDVDVSYSNDGLNFVNSTSLFSYTTPATVYNIHPRSGPNNGGTEIRISGDGFSDNDGWKCLFNGSSVSAVFSSLSEIRCLSPASLDRISPLQLLEPDGSVIETGFTFRYYDELRLISFVPESSPCSGGTTIKLKILGMQLDSYYTCIFGKDVENLATPVNSSLIECTSPRWDTPGETTLSVKSTNSSTDEIVTEAKAFTFYQKPSISEALPSSIYRGISADIYVQGGPFLNSPNSKCRLGQHEIHAHWISESEIMCRYDSVHAPAVEALTSKLSLAISTNGIDFHGSSVLLDLLPDLTVTTISPSYGSLSVRTRVVVKGTHFADTFSYRCLFGTRFVSAEFHTPKELICYSVPSSFPGRVSFSLCVVDGDCVGGEDFEFDYLDSFNLLEVSPKEGSIYGGTLVHVKSNHPFGSHSLCSFGNQRVNLEASDDASGASVCKSPPHVGDTDSPTSVVFSVSANGQEFSREPFQFIYHPPSIAVLDPTMGQTGSEVTVTGKSFHPSMLCQFESRIAETHFVNSTTLKCVAPEFLSRKSIPVSLTLFDAPLSSGPQLYFTPVDLSVAYIIPMFGHVTGGTRVTFILKKETPDDVSHCMFGRNIVPAIVYQSKLVCVSPPSLTHGPQRVGVSVNGKDFFPSELNFEYTKPAVFLTMHPKSGPESGGTIVALTGSNFVNGSSAACYFGDVKASGRWESDERLTCETSAMKPGNYKVRVTLNGVDILDTHLSFVVYPRMTALFSLPSFGKVLGGTSLAVYGTNFRFDDSIFCHFGSVSVNARYVGPNMVECVTPKWKVEEYVDFSVVTEHGDTAVIDSGFAFYKPFHISSIHPTSGFFRGGTNITVSGDHFSQSLGRVYCLFNHTAADAVVVSESQISCTTPKKASRGEVEFALTYGSDEFTLPRQGFRYEDEIVLEALLPGVIPSNVDKIITVFGSMFRNTGDLKCMITDNSRTMDATFVSEAQVLCRVPQGLRPGVYALSVSNNGQDFSESTLDFSLIDLLRVNSIRPTVGSPDTAHDVSLEGSDFRDLESLACLLDEKFVVPSFFVNTTLIRCSIPPNLVDSGTVSVALIIDGVPVSSGPQLLFTFMDLSVNSISPTFGHVTGGTRVTFILKEETPDDVSHCMFGRNIVPAIVYQSKLVCVSPPSLTHGPQRVGVSVNGKDFFPSELNFEYTKPAVFLTMHPKSGPESGGTIVALTGSNFVNGSSAACYFGDVKASGRWESDERLTCETSAMKPGNYKVRVTLNGVDTLRTVWQFSFQKEVDVRYASPSSGSILGGTEISIIGKSFVFAEDLTCRFGDLGYSRAAFVSSTELSCLSPNISPVVTHLIDVGIQVSLNGVDFSPSVAHFRFTPPAVVRSIFPNQGSVSGGTEVTVIGENMFTSISSNAAVCIFGNESVPASLLSTEELTCVSPTHKIDEGVYFAVSLNGVDLLEHTDTRFFYLPNVKSVSIEPSGGPLTGGTLVTVTGTDFDKSYPIGCKFGSSYSDKIVYISGQTIQCWSPPHPPGTVAFVVRTNDNELSLDDVIFEYYKAPSILFADPSSGPQHGGTIVRIYGSDFRSNVHYLCHFGDVRVSGQFVATDAIECLSPIILSDVDEKHVDLVVSETKSNFTANTLRFTYVPAPSLTRLSPQYVFFNGGDLISVFGSHLNTTEDVWCRFTLPSKAGGSHYYETVQASSISSDGHVDCRVPLYPSATVQIEAFVEVSTNGWDYSAARLSIKYVPKPSIHAVHPTMGSVNGGTVITVIGTNFLQESNLWCAFGSAGSVPSEWISDEKISCTTPAAQHPVNNTVSLHFEDYSGVVDGARYFAYHRELSLEEAHPMRGFVTGGTVVTIRGTGFLNAPTLSCRFGNKTVLAKYKSLDTIECSSPLVDQSQDVKLTVSLNGVEFSEFLEASRRTFTFDDVVELIRILPSRVSVTDKVARSSLANVSIIGRSFINTSSLSCLFGQHYATVAQYVSGSEVRCILPQILEEGETDVTISLNGVDFSSDKASITFVGPALISSISPLRIQEGQEVDILVKGSNFFNSSDLQCRFGRRGHYWSPARWIDANTLRCITPQLNLTHDGVEYVGISNNGGSDTARQLFAMEVTSRTQFISMYPALGYTHGGTEVAHTLGNLKYMSNLMCLYGTEAVPAFLTSANSIVCKSPSHSVGNVTLKLMSGKMTLATSSFEYIHPPTVDSLQPFLGALEGGTSVWIYGARFVGMTHCRFIFDDNMEIVPAKVESDSTISCNTPASESDADALVEISHNGQDFSSTGLLFKFRARPDLFSLRPSFGSDLGGKIVHVLGRNFGNTTTMCRFGTILVDATYISPTLLSCVTPALKIGSESVSITMNGVDFISNETLVYESITLPQIESIEPTVGLIYGDTTVLLHTTALRNNRTITCHFGEQSVQASYRSPNSALCVAPPVHDPGIVDVFISVDGEHYLADGQNTISYTYFSEPKAVAISPNIGWTTGGAVVSLSIEKFGPFRSSEVSCSFGDSITFIDALEVGGDSVLCSVPPFSDNNTMRRSAPISLRISDGLNVYQINSISEFTYCEPAIVTKVEPPVGSIRGGSIVRVYGINFSNMHGLQCLFGAGSAVDAEFFDEREVQCVLPEWSQGPKKVEIHIGIKDGAKLSLVSHAVFEYLPHPSIQNIHPRFGSINGGTLVTVLGNSLSWPRASNYLSCGFGNSTLVPVNESPAGDLVCISPPLQDDARIFNGNGALPAVKVPVSVYANHGQIWLASGDEPFVYVEQIQVGTLRPNSGPFNGETIVTFSAHGLRHLPTDQISCHFDDNIVQASYHENEDALKCPSPAIVSSLPSKTVMVHLGINGSRDIDSIGSLFTYYRSPSTTSLFPTFGFNDGGEDVIISGHGFRNEEGFGCIFGHVVSPKAVWLSDTAMLCTSPDAVKNKLTNSRVTVQVTNNGVEYTDRDGAPEYLFTYRPDASNVQPGVVHLNESTNITITGKNLIHASACRFGNLNKTYPLFNVTHNSVICEAPLAKHMPLTNIPLLLHSEIPIYLSMENGVIATGLFIMYGRPPPKVPEQIDQPHVAFASPSHGLSHGGDWVRVYGEGFLNTEALSCNFGETLVSDVHFISASEIHCRTPSHLPGMVSFNVVNSRMGDNQSSGMNFTFVSDVSISSIFPAFGSIKGGTDVRVFGSFSSSSFDSIEPSISCKFGLSEIVIGKLVSQNEISCLSPPLDLPEIVEVRISLDGGQNFAKSSIWFSYAHESEVDALIPSYGYPDGGALILVVGRNFRNSTGLKCIFGELSVSATFLSTNSVSCVSPPHRKKMNANVAVRLAYEGEIGSSWMYFVYVDQPRVTSFNPAFGYSGQGATITVRGSGFRPILQLMCAFDKLHVQATVIDTSTMICDIPQQPPGVFHFRIIDQYALFALVSTDGDSSSEFRIIPESSIYSVASDVGQAGSITFARGTNFDALEVISCRFGRLTTSALVMTDSLLSCPKPFDEETDKLRMTISTYSEGSSVLVHALDFPSAPNGTTMKHNITLCEPGTFQPQNGQWECLKCPIGFICPSFGLSKPVICPAGSICDRMALVVPSSQCVSGHFCKEGTKVSYQMSPSTTETWQLEEDIGVLTTVMSNSAWDFVHRTPPATGERRVSHPPINANVTAEQPFPCPLGYFCREGVSSATHIEGDYTTPQPCFDGYFCPRGSATPEGTGACPTGYYCPTQVLAIPCEIGHYCPGAGNVSPLPCFPGTYSPTPGHSNCMLCEIGFQCPGFERAVPVPCQAGWVCDEMGLSIPTKRCPSGFVCYEGTTTDNPKSRFGVPPKPCPAGSFCLGGVSHNSTSSWLPSFEIGILAPQPCLEGHFCPSNSSTPLGGGKCYPGHYCPESSPYPIQTPQGSFAGEDGGAIVGSLCLPGTFSPRPGQIKCSPCPAGSSCLSYGTYVPRICPAGTYRSKADSIQSISCKSCPERTFSFESGLTDISQCLPCAEGRVCGRQGMTDLKQSDACGEGKVCGYMTDRSAQLMTQCPSGFYCGNETATLNQYFNHCLSGSFCERGTPSNLNANDKCGKSHYCASGTPKPDPLITRCPRQTTSLAGAKDMDFCSPNLVAICDKKSSSETNPFDGLSYYPTFQEESVETLVVKKILPLNGDSSDVVTWTNDTVEVFRSCPSYGIFSEESSAKSINKTFTVIGRNFENSTTLTCRYRFCVGSSWITAGGVVLTDPKHCQDETSSLSESVTKTGTYISKTRISCPMPAFDLDDDFPSLNSSDMPSSSTQLCLRDDKGQMFLSLICSGTDLTSTRCAFEDDVPSLGLRRRVYSLVLPCAEDEILSGRCDDIPSASSKLNPCLTRRMILDVSNSGKKYSGDSTVIPYTSLSSNGNPSHDADNSHQVNPTYATYEFIPEESLRLFEAERGIIEVKHLKSSFVADDVMCRRFLVHEEGRRLGGEGWFESSYMSRFHLSFDWRHLPNHLIYNEHYKVAVFVVPSRCRESMCDDSGRSHSYVEHSPCLQPVALPVWFTDASIDKHQVMNMTLTSLDDSRFRVEVHIVNGLALPVANAFEKTLSVIMEHPQRANTLPSKRNMSPLVSFEEKGTHMPYIFGVRYDESHSKQVSLPRNLPPRWKKFERGRVLVGMNTTHENDAITIKDVVDSIVEGADYWDNPFQSATAAKQQSDIYFETFHGTSHYEPSGSYKYEHRSLILPYLPYFSHCREFDSHVPLWAVVESAAQCQLPGVTEEFPEDWWRRRISPLPHQDDVIAIGPTDFVKFYPVADWCERKLHCNFEENLPKPDVTPRWFDADTGTILFSIIRDPIDYYQYTGRDSASTGSDDGGGQRFINEAETLPVQTFVPAIVDRSPSLYVKEGCVVGACFPRKVTLDVSYYQLNEHSKRIVQVQVLYDGFDKDASNDRYELQIKFRPLNYEELLIKFAFSHGLFLLLFAQIGVGTVVAAFVYWIIVRLTTNLERPPRLRITSFVWLTFPPALGGVLLALVPISIVTASVFYLMKGHLILTPDTDPEGRRWLFSSSIRLHYSDGTIDPDDLQSTRQGRTGLAFVAMALISLHFSCKMFVPKFPSSNNMADQQAGDRAISTWKRGNLICCSVIMSLFLVIIVEWSFWESFGEYIWEAIIFMEILGIIVGSIVDKQLGEALLSAPVMTAMGLVQGIVTMSANDFMDFLLSHIVGFGFLVIERMYTGPLQEDVFGWVHRMFISGVKFIRASILPVIGISEEKIPLDNSKEPSTPEEKSLTVEPLLGSYASYSCDTISLLYMPFIMVVIMVFRDEMEITILYGIKEDDMEYYILFALAIIPFQIVADVFLHNALELLHGWKMHEYLEYCKVRFLQREVWWKGLERSTLDECIDENLRSMDQLCFSSQYYMLNTIHVNAIVYFVLGIEMMARAKYTAFGDPAMFYIVMAVLLCTMAVEMILTSIARLFGLWKIKNEKRSWHANVLDSEGNPNFQQWEEIRVNGHDQYQVEQQITSETFRYKFLSYNRSWLLSKLPDMITPRVSASQKPYLINQFARILSQMNGDSSSDSDSDDGPEFETPSLTSSTRTVARTWLKQAARQLRLKKLVQPLIQQSRGNECQICLSRNLLQVETLHSLSEIDKQFKNEYKTEEIDQVLFKTFWRKSQRYQTVCLPCIQKRNHKEREEIIMDDRSSDDRVDMTLTSDNMTHSAESILASWYAAARERLESIDGDN